MQVFSSKKDLELQLAPLASSAVSIGLVPTMGALHKGHISLVEKAVTMHDAVVVTIFVNPTQFNNAEDLQNYPNDINNDIALLQEVSNDILVFAPTVNEMYTNTVAAQTYDFEGLEHVMEGAFRADHFDGVGTIVEALLRLVKPHSAYFGEKDFQQLQIIKKLVSLKDIPVQIVGCPIVRETHGLAMSSRNERLSKAVRKEAAFIFKTLKKVKTKFGTKSASEVIEWVTKEFKAHPQLRLEYMSITDATTLQAVEKKEPNVKYRAFIAVYADDVRLIDNIALN